MAEGLEALLRSAQVALNPASKTLPSAEERRAEAAAAESLAASGAGDVAKTAIRHSESVCQRDQRPVYDLDPGTWIWILLAPDPR